MVHKNVLTKLFRNIINEIDIDKTELLLIFLQHHDTFFSYYDARLLGTFST